MARPELVRSFVLGAITDLYENLQVIIDVVREDVAKFNESVTEDEVTEVLLELTRGGLAGAYRLSTRPPYATRLSPQSSADMQGLYFLITKAGRTAYEEDGIDPICDED